MNNKKEEDFNHSNQVSGMRVTTPTDLSPWTLIPLPRFFNSRRVPPRLTPSLVLFPHSVYYPRVLLCVRWFSIRVWGTSSPIGPLLSRVIHRVDCFIDLLLPLQSILLCKLDWELSSSSPRHWSHYNSRTFRSFPRLFSPVFCLSDTWWVFTQEFYRISYSS